MANAPGPANIRVVTGQIDADERTTRLLFPTRAQVPWPPFERFAETMTTARTVVGKHEHEDEEVLMYVLEGGVRHVDGTGKEEILTPGSTAVLTAHGPASHDIVTLPGKRARWLSIVLRLPWHTDPPPASLQIREAPEVVEASDGTSQRRVVGPLARADSSMGLEVLDLEFARKGTAFFRIGRDRRAVAYVVAGSGTIHETPVHPGSGVLVENASGLAIGGSPPYRVVLATAPAPSRPEPERPDPVRRRVK